MRIHQIGMLMSSLVLYVWVCFQAMLLFSHTCAKKLLTHNSKIVWSNKHTHARYEHKNTQVAHFSIPPIHKSITIQKLKNKTENFSKLQAIHMNNRLFLWLFFLNKYIVRSLKIRIDFLHKLNFWLTFERKVSGWIGGWSGAIQAKINTSKYSFVANDVNEFLRIYTIKE